MRHPLHVVVALSELGDFRDEVRQVFRELGRTFSAESLAPECTPALDVYETDDRVEIVVDLPGVDASAIRVIARGDSVLIAGDKAPRRAPGDSSFHLVERGYGRFARVIRLERPCNPSGARAQVLGGELRVSLPTVVERRGAAIPIRIVAGA